MTPFPDYVMKSPRLCYALGLIIFLGYVGVGTYESYLQNQYAVDGNPLILVTRLRLVLDALNYSFFFVTTGIFLHIQIAIWQGVVNRQPDVKEATE